MQFFAFNIFMPFFMATCFFKILKLYFLRMKTRCLKEGRSWKLISFKKYKATWNEKEKKGFHTEITWTKKKKVKNTKNTTKLLTLTFTTTMELICEDEGIVLYLTTLFHSLIHNAFSWFCFKVSFWFIMLILCNRFLICYFWDCSSTFLHFCFEILNILLAKR